MDPVVEALKRLVGETAAGRIAVADKLGVSEQNLYQIVSGTLLPSGKPRSVGRRLREKLDLHFPHWLDPLAINPLPTSAQQVTLDQALQRLDVALSQVPAEHRLELQDTLVMWVKHGSKYRQPVAELLLQTPSGKRQANDK